MTRPTPTRYFIGLDPGSTTGLALYDADRRFLMRCLSGSFWEISQLIEEQTFPEGNSMQEAFVSVLGDDAVPVALVVIEDSRRLPLFARNRSRQMTREARDKLCRNVGRIDRDIGLWDEWLKARGYQVLMVQPSREPKWSAEKLERITGWSLRTNEHGRDAARLVWGRSAPVPVELLTEEQHAQNV